MNEVFIALIVALISPSVLHLLAQRSAEETRKQEWARQDRVAMAALDAADKLAHQSNAHKQDTDEKLEVIRRDVNSNMTKALAEIAALKIQLQKLGITPVTEKEGDS